MRMRKSLLGFLGGMAGLFLCALWFQSVDGGTDYVRYHQHLEQPSEAELGICPVCGGTAELCTHLPIINIETGGQKIPGYPVADELGTVAYYETGDNGEEEILVQFSTVSEEGVYHHPTDAPTQTGQALFRIRGNSSRWFSKSNYRLKLVEDDNPELETKQSLLGMTAGTEWSLHGPFLDKTLMRNYMWMNLSAEIMGYAPNVRFCELMLDGEYQGVYVLMEMISVDDGRVDITRYEDGDPITSYLVRIEPKTNPLKVLDNFTLYTYRMEEERHLELLYPGLIHQSQQVKDYVQTDFSEIEKMLYSADMVNGTADWQSVLDINSFVDYYILNEFLAINDSFTASTYFYQDVRGKLCAGPVWDFNNVLDNFFLSVPRREFILSQRGWFSQLMQDEDFVEAVISRYRELREGALSEEYLLTYVDQVEEWLGSAIDRNYEVWGFSFDPNQVSSRERRRPEIGSDLTLEELNPGSYEQAIDWMEDYMIDRGRWMDEHIESLRQYCHPSKGAAQMQG